MHDGPGDDDLMSWSRVSIAVHPSLRGSLARLARGRTLVIGYFASARCGAVVGDFSISWRSDPPGERFRRLAPVENIDVFADARLLEVLETAAPELRPGGVLRRDTPTVHLGIPELWVDFLEGRTLMPARGRRTLS
jgi:hypothetical protein